MLRRDALALRWADVPRDRDPPDWPTHRPARSSRKLPEARPSVLAAARHQSRDVGAGSPEKFRTRRIELLLIRCRRNCGPDGCACVVDRCEQHHCGRMHVPPLARVARRRCRADVAFGPAGAGPARRDRPPLRHRVAAAALPAGVSSACEKPLSSAQHRGLARPLQTVCGSLSDSRCRGEPDAVQPDL